MQAALQQQLVAAQLQHAVDLGAVLVDGGDERALRLVRLAMEIAELAPRDTHVGYIHVAVDLPRHHVRIGHHIAAHLVGHGRQLGQIGPLPQPIRLLARQHGAVARLGEYLPSLHHFLRLGTINSKSSVRRRKSAPLTRIHTSSPSVRRRPVLRPTTSKRASSNE